MAAAAPVATTSTTLSDEEPPPPLRVLCFGDSLTGGWWNWGCTTSPYSKRLEERLRATFPDREIRVETNGLAGAMVSGSSFADRLERLYRHEHEGFDWVIILGGTNDLGYRMPVESIQAGLGRVWECAWDHGARVLALTVPEARLRADLLDQRRDALNSWIMAQSNDGFYKFDLRTAIPYHSLSPEDREKYWDDGLHLTGDGYQWMGEHIATALIELIRQDV